MSNKTFTTPKGTALPLMNIKGKDYLQVQHRLIWFREERPEWGIETELILFSPDVTTAKAVIRDNTGRIIAMAHKTEDRKGFGDHLEKAETGSIGRALALCGFGTQFTAFDLDEGDRLADSPSPTTQHPSPTPQRERDDYQHSEESPGDHVIKIGKKHKGQKIKDLDVIELSSFVEWVQTKSDDKFRNSNPAQEFLFYANAYIDELLDIEHRKDSLKR